MNKQEVESSFPRSKSNNLPPFTAPVSLHTPAFMTEERIGGLIRKSI